LLHFSALQARDPYDENQAIPNTYRAAFLLSLSDASSDEKAKI
jgi:hypothetical protein